MWRERKERRFGREDGGKAHGFFQVSESEILCTDQLCSVSLLGQLKEPTEDTCNNAKGC